MEMSQNIPKKRKWKKIRESMIGISETLYAFTDIYMKVLTSILIATYVSNIPDVDPNIIRAVLIAGALWILLSGLHHLLNIWKLK